MIRKVLFSLLILVGGLFFQNCSSTTTYNNNGKYYYGDVIKINIEAKKTYKNSIIKYELFWVKNANEGNESLIKIVDDSFINKEVSIKIEIPTANWNDETIKMLFEKNRSYFEEYFCINIYANDKLISKNDKIWIAGRRLFW